MTRSQHESWMTLPFFFFQAEDGIRDRDVTGVQTCALPISVRRVIASFAAHAANRANLVIKQHPLDSGLTNWRRVCEAAEIGRASCRERVRLSGVGVS